jgi:hypothetical protein
MTVSEALDQNARAAERGAARGPSFSLDAPDEMLVADDGRPMAVYRSQAARQQLDGKLVGVGRRARGAPGSTLLGGRAGPATHDPIRGRCSVRFLSASESGHAPTAPGKNAVGILLWRRP